VSHPTGPTDPTDPTCPNGDAAQEASGSDRLGGGRPDGSRVEAAEAGLHAESVEARRGAAAELHVTATDIAGPHPHAHHPADPNLGLVRMRLAPGAMLAGVLAFLVTVAALAWLAYAVRAH